jgi:hypothetical protein
MMAEARRLTNVIVAHEATLLENIEASCPQEIDAASVSFSSY